jgi:hypothetical protein
VLVPVVAELEARGLSVEAHASGPALAQWAKSGAAVRGHEEPVSVASAAAALGDAQRLVSGAGVFNTIEHTFRKAAAERALPSLSVFDFWGRVDDRFRRDAANGYDVVRPEVVCALDDANRRELLAAGFSAEQIVVTGSPHLERVARFLGEGRPEREHWRRELGFEPDERLILFASEPFDASDRHADGRPRLGYDQASTLYALLRAADTVATADGTRIGVIARPHPRETGTALADVIAGWNPSVVRVRLDADGDARRAVVAADIVTGMTSVVLIEAALARRPSLSVQIGLRESGQPDPNPANGLGLTRPVLDPAALVAALRDAIAGRHPLLDETRRRQLAGPGCAARVADVVLGHRPR